MSSASPHSAVPVDLAGKWAARNAEHTRVVAQAETLPQLWEAVLRAKIVDPVFEKVPRADVLR
jgi:hypothetical protein